MNTGMPSPVRFKGFASLHEKKKMSVAVSCEFPFHTPERGPHEGFGTPGHALDRSCVRACGRMSHRSDSAELIEASARREPQLPQRKFLKRYGGRLALGVTNAS
jgi:hypothetical protein